MARQKTEWGTVMGTGAASIDLVSMSYPIGQEFTLEEIDAEVVRRGLPNRGAKNEHFRTLKTRGYVIRGTSPRSWRRVK